MGFDNEAESGWVVSFLVHGDEAGVMAVSAEGLIKTTLWEHGDGAQPLASTVTRFRDLSDADQAQWRRLLQQQADDW